jgi:multisubunit Na+/H+ antiporter MnhC subunit
MILTACVIGLTVSGLLVLLGLCKAADRADRAMGLK